MYFQFYFFLFLLILNYFIFKYFLINTNKFNKFKLNKTIGIRWGNSKKSHLGGIIFFLNISLFFFYFFFYEKLYDLSNIKLVNIKIDEYVKGYKLELIRFAAIPSIKNYSKKFYITFAIKYD